jgi:hypothetical protein
MVLCLNIWMWLIVVTVPSAVSRPFRMPRSFYRTEMLCLMRKTNYQFVSYARGMEDQILFCMYDRSLSMKCDVERTALSRGYSMGVPSDVYMVVSCNWMFVVSYKVVPVAAPEMTPNSLTLSANWPIVILIEVFCLFMNRGYVYR